jgi:hypothetical protein
MYKAVTRKDLVGFMSRLKMRGYFRDGHKIGHTPSRVRPAFSRPYPAKITCMYERRRWLTKSQRRVLEGTTLF